MKKPTAAQRAVLEKLAKGAMLDGIWRRPKFLWGEFINQGTWDALWRHGWVTPRGITDAGRAAIQD